MNEKKSNIFRTAGGIFPSRIQKFSRAQNEICKRNKRKNTYDGPDQIHIFNGAVADSCIVITKYAE